MKVGNPEVGKVGTRKGVKKVEEVHNGRRLVGYEDQPKRFYKVLVGYMEQAPEYAGPVPYAGPREEVEVVIVGSEDEEKAKKAALRLLGVEDTGVILSVEDVTRVVFSAIDAAELEADAAALDALDEVYNEGWIKAFGEALKKRGWVLVKAFDFGSVYVFSRRLWAVFKISWEDGNRYIELPRYLPADVKDELLKLFLGGVL